MNRFKHVTAIRSVMKRLDEPIEMCYKTHEIVAVRSRSNDQDAPPRVQSEMLYLSFKTTCVDDDRWTSSPRDPDISIDAPLNRMSLLPPRVMRLKYK